MFATKRQGKVTLFIALAVLLIGVVVTFVYANRDSDSGITDDGVYWDAFIANVYYDEARDTTHSDHGFYVENGSPSNVTVDYEFTHRVMKESAVLIERKQTGIKNAYRINHPVETHPRSAYDTKDYRVDVSHLDGPGHKIDAYTRLTLVGKGVDKTFNLVVNDIEFP